MGVQLEKQNMDRYLVNCMETITKIIQRFILCEIDVHTSRASSIASLSTPRH